MKRLAFVLAAAGLLGTPAVADGMPRSAPVASQCCQANWQGFYVGAAVGYGFAATQFDERHAAGLVSGGNSYDLGGQGLTGTVVVGLDREVARGIFLGAFADYTFGEQEASFTLDFAGATKFSLSYDNTWAVGGRLGLARSCCTLWYVTAGYTGTQVNFEGIEKNLGGYFVGGGVEHMLRDNLSLKLEYRFSDYGGTNLFSQSSGCCSQNIHIDNEIHAVRLGIAYRFNHPR